MAGNPEKRQSYMKMRDLCSYYHEARPTAIMSMNTRKYRHTKCVATTEREQGVVRANTEHPLLIAASIVAPDVPSEGTEQWFLYRWAQLLPQDKENFRSYMSGALNLTDPLDFCVDVDERAGVQTVVIFYINSVLTPLAQQYFRNVDSLQQALAVLHRPDTEYMAFWYDAVDHHEEHMRDGSGTVALRSQSRIRAQVLEMRGCLWRCN